ncbi:superoxide dismutase family protein [Cupriavidus sp. PET2-C1]
MKRVRVLFGLAVAGTLAGTLAGCGSMGMGSSDTAVAALASKSGTATQGSITFTQRGDKVLVKADVTGLPPNTEHGFHVHEKGDCSAPDAMSAGGHFNPTGKPHGSMSMPDHHAGDINNLKADATGRAQASFELTGVTLGAGPTSLVGRAVVVHKDPDDYKTQPTGNSGGRIACGVIAKS